MTPRREASRASAAPEPLRAAMPRMGMSPCSADQLANSGISWTQGPHQVPQKFKSVTRPVNVGAGRDGSAIDTSGISPIRLPTAGCAGDGPEQPGPITSRRAPAATSVVTRGPRARQGRQLRRIMGIRCDE